MLNFLNPKRLFASRRSIVKMTVWIAFLAFLAIGSTQLKTPSITSSHSLNHSTIVLAASPGSNSSTTSNLGSPTSPATAYNNTLNGALANKGLSQNADHYLPAIRWSGATSLYSNLGVGDVIGNIEIFLATLSFAIGSFIWTVLFTVAEYALSANLLKDASYAIDSTFYSLASTFTTAALVTVLFVVTAGYAVVSYLRKGRGPGPLRIILAFIIPIAFLQALALTANKSTSYALAHGVSSQKYVSPVGAPAWLAVEADNFISSVVNPITTGISSIGIGGNPITSNGSASTTVPDCTNYYAALDGQYQYELKQSPNKSNLSSLQTLSTIWQDSYLNEYTAAQFSSAPYAANASCRLLEFNAHIPQNEQQALTLASYPNVSFPAQSSTDVFNLGLSGNSTPAQEQSALLSWSACSYQNGNWTVNPGWGASSSGSSASNTPAPGRLSQLNPTASSSSSSSVQPATSGSGGSCDTWWNTGNTGGALSITNYSQVQPLLTSSNPAVAQSALEMSTLLGHEQGASIVDALVALITTIAMMITLGAVIVGSLLAQIGLIVLMVLLPASLFLVATPGKLRAIGTRLLKLTGGFLMGRFALAAALAVITLLMGTLYNLTSTTTSNPIIEMAIPILTIFLLRYLTKKAGLGSLSSFQGAAMMPLAAAAALSGERGLSRSFSSSRPASALAGAPLKGISALGQRSRERAITASKIRQPSQAIKAAWQGQSITSPLTSLKKDLASPASIRSAAGLRAAKKAATSPGEFAALAAQAHGLTPGSKLSAKLQSSAAGLGAKLTSSPVSSSLASAALGAMTPPLAMSGLNNMAKNIGLATTPLSSSQTAGLRAATAASLGLGSAAVLTSSSGLSVLAPLPRSSSGALQIPANYGIAATRAALGNGLNYLPASQVTRRLNESDDAFATRMAATAVAAGLITENGTQADVLPAALGVEPNPDGSLPLEAEEKLNTLASLGGDFVPENAFALGLDAANFATANAWLEGYAAPPAQPYEEKLQHQNDEIAALDYQRDFLMGNTQSTLEALSDLGSLAKEFSDPNALNTHEARIDLEARLEAAAGAVASSLNNFTESANLANTSVGIAQAALNQDPERIENLAFSPQAAPESVTKLLSEFDSLQGVIAPLYRLDSSPTERYNALSAIEKFTQAASRQVENTYQETLSTVSATSARLVMNRDLTAQSIATIAPQGDTLKSSRRLLRRNRVV